MTITLSEKEARVQPPELGKRDFLEQLVEESWQIIAPYWPLKNLIAVNPLQGLENLSFEEALLKSEADFQREDLPKPMETVNRETIKWVQAYFDAGQAAVPMPLRNAGLYLTWKQLAVYDVLLHRNDPGKISWLKSLPDSPKQALAHSLSFLKIPQKEAAPFLKLLLTSMPGWAGYIKYRAKWSDQKDGCPVTQVDYLAVRIVMTCLLWPEASRLLEWSRLALQEVQTLGKNPLKQIEQFEKNYRLPLLKQLASQPLEDLHTPSAQLVFCIDVRSESFRRSLEAAGDYETFGFAGFFGIPVRITDVITEESYASCPVLLSPKHDVKESPLSTNVERQSIRYQRLCTLKKIYQSVKYTFATPFAMVEALGIAAGAWIGLRTFTPKFAHKLKKAVKKLICKPSALAPSLDAISFEDQCAYAEGALRMIGLTRRFAPLIVFCGHGSSTQNNAYASALDCGACGGRRGSSNARILASILNRPEVRVNLAKKGIPIPETTLFIGAEHNTTTDEVVLYNTEPSDGLIDLKKDLEKARRANSFVRLGSMELASSDCSIADTLTLRRSQDWAQVRPEWGLAGNAAFIIAPRALTKSLNLGGRCFLHSYEHTQDPDGKLLETILTAPMVVAQWINSQYLFSTLDNTAYGGGSKITGNITGKIGIMQGNASDLMTGLPLQSVYCSDKEPYHEPQRLMTVVFAPRTKLDLLIQKQPILQKLFGNGWVQLVCIEPESRLIYFMDRKLSWERNINP